MNKSLNLCYTKDLSHLHWICSVLENRNISAQLDNNSQIFGTKSDCSQGSAVVFGRPLFAQDYLLRTEGNNSEGYADNVTIIIKKKNNTSPKLRANNFCQ